ncbi:zinc-binding alcohol dehydrogenase family protein [Aspergillus fijiensis CBS 313.89]|uniref:Putative enoyl reductase n=1 Tax=Aspergillus fijiensis CBS 313.89 TaxID=1448319 RepID=A0A8G1S1D6_9EURO|nr:putative enoyl reductase [Aspergillus fijiensis CBS 313.89]RAK81610.1 putative enoyl reductase [Aspergillus fijiensis CBS 313.89]
MSELPTTQQALKIAGPGSIELQTSQPLPQLGADEVLVRVACVGLNPYDAKSADISPSPGATAGLDFAGEIVALGEGVTSSAFSSSRLALGTRVCGCVFGNNAGQHDNGAFAEYVAVPAALVLCIPDSMSFQQAATLGCGLATTGLALYQTLGLPLTPTYVLVYGGGTATGTLAIQVLRRSGFTPLTTSSPHNFPRLQQLGAAATFDYRSPTCGSDLRDHTANTLAFALDCISTTESMQICYEAIGRAGGKYVSLDPFPLSRHTRRSVRPEWVFLFTQFGREIVGWEAPYNLLARPADRAAAERWYAEMEAVLAEGGLVTHPVQEESGGLRGVIGGIDAVRRGQASGFKLVYPLWGCA